MHPGDVPEETASLHKWEAAILNTGKPVGTEATSAYDCRKLIEMATVVAGGEDEFRRRPLIGFGVCPVSPLKLPRDATEVIIESARAWCPDTIIEHGDVRDGRRRSPWPARSSCTTPRC